jgi:hypothetical protein
MVLAMLVWSAVAVVVAPIVGRSIRLSRDAAKVVDAEVRLQDEARSPVQAHRATEGAITVQPPPGTLPRRAV